MITAAFNDSMSTTATGLWQWDYGQELLITGVSCLEKTPEIHFSAGGEEALIVLAEKRNDGSLLAKIPDPLLELGCDLKAYLYVADTESGETIRTIRMPVNRRPEPEDYSAPAEKNLLRQLMEEIKKKADGLQLVEEDSLQLLSGEEPIGVPVDLPATGGPVGIESITNPEIDEIMQ
ncbi:hypothetical protein B5F37_11545 [Drancourtella sp. An210]|nr:hypothetical protein B5F37_11545 [Drancourtella sp. An210]